jgi:acyl dehydratase
MTRQVSAKDIELFTAISGDHNPLHYNKELAEATRFGGIIVQGGVTSAILNAVVAEKLPGPGTVFLHVDWNFRAPVRPGDRITGAVEVRKVRTDKPNERLKYADHTADGIHPVGVRRQLTALPSGTWSATHRSRVLHQCSIVERRVGSDRDLMAGR